MMDADTNLGNKVRQVVEGLYCFEESEVAWMKSVLDEEKIWDIIAAQDQEEAVNILHELVTAKGNDWFNQLEYLVQQNQKIKDIEAELNGLEAELELQEPQRRAQVERRKARQRKIGRIQQALQTLKEDHATALEELDELYSNLQETEEQVAEWKTKYEHLQLRVKQNRRPIQPPYSGDITWDGYFRMLENLPLEIRKDVLGMLECQILERLVSQLEHQKQELVFSDQVRLGQEIATTLELIQIVAKRFTEAVNSHFSLSVNEQRYASMQTRLGELHVAYFNTLTRSRKLQGKLEVARQEFQSLTQDYNETKRRLEELEAEEQTEKFLQQSPDSSELKEKIRRAENRLQACNAALKARYPQSERPFEYTG